MPFLVIDTQGINDGNLPDDCIREYASENEMLVAIEDEAKEYDLDDGTRYFNNWRDGLSVYEIVRKVPLNIDVAVTVEVAKPEEPEPDPIENVVRGIFEGSRRGYNPYPVGIAN